MKFREYILSFILVFQVCLVSFIQSINIKDLKGTYSILKPEYRYCSPVHGAIWWEMDLVKKYYHFGNVDEVLDARGRPMHKMVKLEGSEGKEVKSIDLGVVLEGDDTIKLIHQLFHVVQGSFGVTSNASYPAYHFSARTVGVLIGCIEKLKEEKDLKILQGTLERAIREDGDFRKSLEQTAEKQVALEAEINLLKKDLDAKKIEIKEVDLFLGKLRPFLEKAKSKPRDEKIATYLVALEGLEKKLEQEKKPEEKKEEKSDGELKSQIEALERELTAFKKKNPEYSKEPEKLQQVKAQAKKIEDLKKRLPKLSLAEQMIQNIKIFKARVELLSGSDMGKKYEAYIRNEEVLKNLSKELANNNADRAFRLIQDFVSSLIGSLQESGFIPSKKIATYLPGTTHSILLAFLHRKTSEKAEIRSYFNALDEQLDGKMLVENKLPEGSYDQKNVDEIIAKIKHADPKMLVALDPSLKLSYEDIAYAEIMKQVYTQALPKMAGYRTLIFEGHVFSDCVDTTIRNLCNIVLYDKKEAVFLTEKFNLTESMRNFYRDNRLAATVEDAKVHLAWVKVVRSLPYVTYGRAVSLADNITTLSKAPVDQSYIYIPAEGKIVVGEYKEITLGGKNYRVVDPDKYALHEVVPSLKNIIIILDQLLGLNLYGDKKIEEEFKRPDFNQIYFSKLCEKLNWNDLGVEGQDLDAREFSQIGMCINVNNQFTINLLRWHGYITLVSADQQAEGEYRNKLFDCLLSKLIESGDEKAYSPERYDLSSLVNLYSPSTYALLIFVSERTNQLGKIPDSICHLFFLQDLLNENNRVSLLDTLLCSESGVDWQNELVYHLAAKIILSFPINEDLYYQKAIISKVRYTKKNQVKLIKEALEKLVHRVEGELVNFASGEFEFLKDCFELDLYPLDKMLSVTQQEVARSDHSKALDFLEGLVKKGLGFKEAMFIAKQKMEKERYGLAAKFYTALIEEDKDFKAFEEAAIVAKTQIERNIDYEADYDFHLGLALLGALFAKGKGFEEAAEVAKKGIESEKPKALKRALNLYQWLIEKNKEFKEFKEVVIAAQKGMENKSIDIQKKSVELFEALFERGQSFAEAFTIIQKKMESYAGESDDAKYAVGTPIALLRALIQKNKDFKEFKEAMVAVKKVIGIDIPYTKINLFELLKILVEKGYGFKEAYSLAKKQSDDYWSRLKEDAIKLIERIKQKLKERGAVIEEGDGDASLLRALEEYAGEEKEGA